MGRIQFLATEMFLHSDLAVPVAFALPANTSRFPSSSSKGLSSRDIAPTHLRGHNSKADRKMPVGDIQVKSWNRSLSSSEFPSKLS